MTRSGAVLPTRLALALACALAAGGTALLVAGAGRPGPPAPAEVLGRTAVVAVGLPEAPGTAVSRAGAAAPSIPAPAVARTSQPVPAASEPVPAASEPVPAVLGLPRSEPVRLTVPAIGVDTTIVPVGLQPDGTVEVPPLGKGSPAGWYRYLASPGEVGPAVILGHVDSAADGPAVFYRLGALQPGDTVTVARQDGSTARFRVSRVAQYPKDAFPTQEVYGATDSPALRLITCGGTFDPRRHAYTSNVVVFADPA